MDGALIFPPRFPIDWRNTQTRDNRTAAQLIGAVSVVRLVLCAQLTPEEQLLGSGEPLWDQLCSEQVTGAAGRMDPSERETPQHKPKHIQRHRGHANCPHIKMLVPLDTKTWTRWAVKSHLKTRLYGIFTQSVHFEGKGMQMR